MSGVVLDELDMTGSKRHQYMLSVSRERFQFLSPF